MKEYAVKAARAIKKAELRRFSSFGIAAAALFGVLFALFSALGFTRAEYVFLGLCAISFSALLTLRSLEKSAEIIILRNGKRSEGKPSALVRSGGWLCSLYFDFNEDGETKRMLSMRRMGAVSLSGVKDTSFELWRSDELPALLTHGGAFGDYFGSALTLLTCLALFVAGIILLFKPA